MNTRAELMEAFSYDAETGDIRWLVSPCGRAKAGELAGRIDRQGYRVLSYRRKFYLAHRVAWLFAYGEWPNGVIDHINLDRADNRIANLRVATVSQNSANCAVRRTGLKGVCFSAKAGRFRAQIKCGGKNHYLGSFDTEADAHAAYLAAAQRLHGEFARAA